MKRSGKVFTALIGILLAGSLAAGLAAVAAPAASTAQAGTAADGPANPNASQAARNILNYLRDVSFSEQTILGAFDWPDTNGYGGKSPENFRDHHQYIEKEYDFQVGMLGLHFPLKNNTSTTYEFDYTLEQAEKAYSEGRILIMHFSNQWEYIFIEKYGDLYQSNPNMFLRHFDSSYAERDRDLYNDYMAIVKQWGDGLEKLQDRGITVLFRAFGEMTNHPCFRAYSKEGKEHFKNIWRQLFAYLVEERGLNNILFGYTPLIPGSKNNTHLDTDGFGYYPGDDVVDVLCPTMYPNGGNGLEEYLQWGWDYSNYIATGKPFGISELGLSANGDHTTSLPSASMKADYGRFMNELKLKMPRTSFIVLWTDTLLYPSATNVEPFLNDPRVVSLEEIPGLSSGTYAPVGDIVTYSGTDFGGEKRQTLSDGRYSQTQLKKAGFDPAKAASLRMAGDRAITFYKEDGCQGEGWMFLGDVPSLAAYGFDGSKVKSVEIKALDRNPVSTGKPAQASVAAEDAALANDGEWTSWDTAEGTGSWVSIDLQGLYLLNRWKVEHGNTIDRGVKTNTCDYRLQYSMDGRNWKDADVVMGNWYDSTTRDIAQIRARYVRLYIDRPNSETEELYQSYASIVDWGVYGVQIAPAIVNTEPSSTTEAARTNSVRTEAPVIPAEPDATESEPETTDTAEGTSGEGTSGESSTTAPGQATSVATSDRQTGNMPEKRPVLPWIIGGAVLLVATGGVTFLLVWRRKAAK